MHTAHKLPHQRALITHVTAGRCVRRPCVVTCLLLLNEQFDVRAAGRGCRSRRRLGWQQLTRHRS